MKIKKQLLASVMAGALLLSGSIAMDSVSAAEAPGQNQCQCPGCYGGPDGQRGFGGPRQRGEGPNGRGEFRRDGATRDNAKMAEFINKRTGIEQSTLKKLLDEGYNPRDLGMAGIIAKESGKGIETVLAKKKLNNRWDDVAKTFGVDMRAVMEKERRNFEKNRPQPQGQRPGNSTAPNA